MSLRGALGTKQSQSEIATPFGLAMTTFCDSECKLFHALSNKEGSLSGSLHTLDTIGRNRGHFMDEKTIRRLFFFGTLPCMLYIWLIPPLTIRPEIQVELG